MTTNKVDVDSSKARTNTSRATLLESNFSLTFSEDENKERGNWSGRLDFILSCIGYAVGFGNVWRFPYLCYRNGGGAFLIPYTIMLTLAGLPLFFLELAFGQYASLSPISIWKISPFFTGVGYSMAMISGLVSIYYNVILAYVIFYLFASMTTRLPWSDCGNAWNTPSCTQRNSVNESFQTIAPAVTSALPSITAANISAVRFKPTSPAQEYWERYVLDISSGIDHPGTLRWPLVLCLLAAWIIVFLCLIKGIKSTGKVVYFTATFPYLVLFILLIRGVTLPGAGAGVYFYIVPEFKRLADAKVWGDAAVQIFYSLGPGWGGLITMASYNRFHNNCYRDAIIVSVVNCGTSIFAGFVIFSVVGFLAHELNLPVANATDSGPGLAFVAYPEGLARMPGAPFWSIIFFLMLITLGLDSMFAGMETVVSSLSDVYPQTLRRYKSFFTLILCIIFFMLGLPQVTNGGIYLMNLMDWYCAGYSLLLVSVVEVTVIMYIYGYGRFAKDIESMIGFQPRLYWKVCWCVITPLLILAIIVFNSINDKPVKFNDYVYPSWAITLGWLMMTVTLVPIPTLMLVTTLTHIGGIKELPRYVCSRWNGETIRRLVAPQLDWGPALKENWRKRHQEVQTTPELKKRDYAYDNPGFNISAVMYESYI